MLFLHTFFHAVACIIISAALPGTNYSAATGSPSEVFTKVNTALAGMTAIQYDYVRVLNYPSESYYHELRIATYLEFTTGGAPLDFKFQTDEPETAQIYNGSELFTLRKKTKSINVNRKATLGNLKHLSFLYNSPLTLRNTLPAILADAAIPKTLADTMVDHKHYHIIRFSLGAKTLNNIQGYQELASGTTISYQLLIDTSTYLPVEVLQTNSENKDYIKTNFVALTSSPKAPAESSWYSSTYLDAYRLEQSKQVPIPIAAGTTSPTWRLPLYGSTDSVDISKSDSKVTLLEFWYKNCGFCIAAVPSLNKLANMYKGKNFRLLAVNVFDSERNIEQFLTKTNPAYPTLYNGNAVAMSYGINTYPSVVLLDKNKKVLYVGDLDLEKLEALIRASVAL